MTKLIVGLPHLSQGRLFRAALDMNAPVMVSASCLGKWKTHDHKGTKHRDWQGWNTRPLDKAQPTGLEIHLDSAGFVAMALRGGYDWSPESYVCELAAHPAVARASSMDLCVEREVANNRTAVKERIAKTINLNHRCYQIAKDEGISAKLMQVIQGDTVEDYLGCFEAIEAILPSDATIGVGSMCRRPTNGPNGALEIIAGLDDKLPRGITLHLFGVKSDAAEAAMAFGNRISSVDSQAYGTRARMIAGERRKEEPGFSKTDAFVAQVMQDWYRRQSERLASPRTFQRQPHLDLLEDQSTRTVLEALEQQARDEFNSLISEGALDFDQLVGGRMLEEDVMGRIPRLPSGVRPHDIYKGPWQLPVQKAVY